MRILHTEWSDGWGGQERRIVSEMAGMQRRGHAVWLATRPSARIAQEAERQGIPVVRLPFRHAFDLVTLGRLLAFIRREKIDVVNTHSGKDSWVGGLAARLARTRLVRTRHLDLPLRRSPINFVHYLPHRVIACGEAMRERLVRDDGFPDARVTSIPTGVDFERFAASRSRAATRRELGIGSADFVVLMVGVIRGVKRHEVALRAFATVLAARSDAWLVLAGEGPMRSDTEQLARELGIAARVLFLGHREDVADLLAAADVLLLTSRSEGVPQAVTQALGSGVPVVSTRVGGVTQLVLDGETGLLAEAEDAGTLASHLLRLASDPTLLARLGEQGRSHARARFSLDAMLDATERVYSELLACK